MSDKQKPRLNEDTRELIKVIAKFFGCFGFLFLLVYITGLVVGAW